MPRSSSIWTYFEKQELEGIGFMKCTVCGQLYKLVDGSTTGARSHLLRKHPELIPASEWKKKVPGGLGVKRRRSSISSSTQQAIENMVARKRKTTDTRVIRSKNNLYKMVVPQNMPLALVDRSDLKRVPAPVPAASTSQQSEDFVTEKKDPRASTVTNKILKMILSQNLAFSFVDHPSFKELLEEVVPAYSVPDRKEFLTTHLNDAMHKVVEETRNHMKTSSPLGYAFTSDVWRSKAGDNYVDFHVFYIDKDFKELHYKLLDVTGMTDSSSSDNIIHKFHQLLHSYGINPAEIFITYNSESMVPDMWEGTHFNRIQCIGHELNSVVRKALYAVPEAYQAFECGSRMVGHISGVVKKYIREEISQLPQLLQLVQHVAMQWNSYLFQEDWLLKLKPTIDLMTLEHADMPMRTSEEWTIAQQCVVVMKPLEQLTKAINGCSYPTLSTRIPLFEKSKREIQKILEKNSHFHEKSVEFGKELLDSIDYYRDQKKNQNMENWAQAATSLDPRFKTILFDDATILQVTNTLVDLHDKIQKDLTPAVDPVVAIVNNVDNEWSFLEEKKNESDQPQTDYTYQTVFENELKRFWAGGWIGIQECPLQWWRNHKIHFPFVGKLAQILLAVPAASLSNEHLQSPTGNIVVPKLISMDPLLKKSMLFTRAALCLPKDGVQSSRNFPDVSDDEEDVAAV